MLTVIQVGHDEASDRYIRSKKKAVEEAGMQMKVVNLPESITTNRLITAVYNADSEPGCAAILVQLPLPKHIDRDLVMRNIPPDRDIDGLNPGSLYEPLTPCAIMRWLKQQGVKVEGKNVAIFGKSDLVGKPLASMLLDAGAAVTVMGSKAEDRLRFLACRTADIVISAVGKPNVVTEEHVGEFSKPRILIDVGINRDENGKLCGDISARAREFVEKNGGTTTSVPGGVGKWTVEELILRLKEMEGRAK